MLRRPVDALHESTVSELNTSWRIAPIDIVMERVTGVLQRPLIATSPRSLSSTRLPSLGAGATERVVVVAYEVVP